MEDKLVGDASRVKWMYVLRLAVGLGQIGVDKWRGVQQQLLESREQVDIRELHGAHECIHALFHSFSREFSHRGIRQGVLSRSAEKRVDLTTFIERGYSRLAKVNLLLRALLNKTTDLGQISSSERASALNQLTGMLVGEYKLHPKLAATLLAAMGCDIIRRASVYPEDVPKALTIDIGNLISSSKGVLGALSQQAAGTVTKLAATLAVTDALSSWGDDLPIETGRRGAALQDQLWRDIRTYRSNRSTVDAQVAGLLTAAQDFIKEGSPCQVEHEPGTTQLDVMIILLGVVTTGCVYPLLHYYTQLLFFGRVSV